ncbi:hypothetical protein ACIBUY_03845 [Streptomyces sp. NPDC050085]|uniref:hypothetical protein n=1 Tax=Streptomyces sp. NPDC050085 TaxID=3365600 RepID=UPI003796820B
MTEYSESDRELFARDVARELKALSPENVEGYRAVARRLVAAGITVAMVEELGPVGGARRDRLEYALARALVDMEVGPLGDAAGEGYDEEILTWNINNLTYSSQILELAWADTEPEAPRPDDQGETNEIALPHQADQNLAIGMTVFQDALMRSSPNLMIEDMLAGLSRERRAMRLHEQGFSINYEPPV